jgi:hypothetical protein
MGKPVTTDALLQDSEKVLNQVAEFYSSLQEELKGRIVEYEKGIENSPIPKFEDRIYPILDPKLVKDQMRFDELPLDESDIDERHYILGTLLHYSLRLRKELEDSFIDYDADRDKVIFSAEHYRIIEPSSAANKHLQQGTGPTASVNDTYKTVSFRKLPKNIFTSPEVQDTVKPNIEYLVNNLIKSTALNDENDDIEFKGITLHELTHLYLYEEANSFRKSEKTIDSIRPLHHSIQEGAARVVGYIVSGQEVGIRHYRTEKDIRAEDLQVTENILHKIAEEVMNNGGTKKEAISQVRGKAVKAYKSLLERPNQDLIAAFNEHEGHYRTLRRIFRLIEQADMTIWDVVELYDLNPGEKDRDLVRGPRNTLHSPVFEAMEKSEESLFDQKIDAHEIDSGLKSSQLDYNSIVEEFEKIKNTLEEIRNEINSVKKERNPNKRELLQKDLEFLNSTIEYIQTFLNFYRTNKMDSVVAETLKELESELEFEDAVEIYNDQIFLSSKRFMEAKKTISQRLEKIVEAYKAFISAAAQTNNKLLQICEKMNDEAEKETDLIQEHHMKERFSEISERLNRDIDEQLKTLEESSALTQEVHKFAANAQIHLKKSQNLLEQAKNELEKLENS